MHSSANPHTRCCLQPYVAIFAVMTITKRTIQKKVSIPQEGPVRFDNTTTAENRPPTKASSQPFNKSLFTFIFISLSLLLAAVSWYYAVKKTIGIKPEFPDTYALCSLDGEDIYTVDEANSKVQCIVIQRSRILSTGSLSKIDFFNNSGFRLLIAHSLRRDLREIKSRTEQSPG